MLGAELLPDRVLAAQHLELGDELRGVPHRQLGVDPRFHCGEPELLETLRLELERERSAHVSIRVPAPEGERGPQSLSGFRRARLDQLSRLLDFFGELDCVDGAGVELEPVAATLADDHVADRSAEVRDVGLQGRPRSRRRLLAPDPVDERVDGDDLAGTRRKKGQHRALLRSAERDLDAALQDPYGPQDPYVYIAHIATIRRCGRDRQGRGIAMHDVAHSCRRPSEPARLGRRAMRSELITELAPRASARPARTTKANVRENLDCAARARRRSRKPSSCSPSATPCPSFSRTR